MPKAPTVNPKDIFSDSEWAELQTRADWRGAFMVAHAWGVIFFAFAIHAIWPNPLTWLLAVLIIGTRQLGLAILMHEAAHGGLNSDQKINDLLGQWLCAGPLAFDLNAYRTYHLAHHKYTQQAEDPDLGLVPDYPISPESFKRKIIRDLTGQTFYKQRIRQFSGILGQGRNHAYKENAALTRFVVTNFALWFILMMFGQGWAFVTIWLFAHATWFMAVTRIRNIGEHAAATEDINDPWQLARTVLANTLERAFIAPYHVHFHAEHHLWMHIPCYNLPRTHELLAKKGHTSKMVIANGYREMLETTANRSE